MSIRSEKERMRRAVHATHGVAALYRADPAASWVAVTVRVHDRLARFGDSPGLDAAQSVDISPRLVFLVEELDGGTPRRGSIVSVAAGEAWLVGDADPADDITVTASASRVPPAQAESFPVPD